MSTSDVREILRKLEIPQEWLSENPILKGKAVQKRKVSFDDTHSSVFEFGRLDRLTKTKARQWHGIEILELDERSSNWPQEDKDIPLIRFAYVWPRSWPMEKRSKDIKDSMADAVDSLIQRNFQPGHYTLKLSGDEIVKSLKDISSNEWATSLTWYGYRLEIESNSDTVKTVLKKIPDPVVVLSGTSDSTNTIFEDGPVTNTTIVADWGYYYHDGERRHTRCEIVGKLVEDYHRKQCVPKPSKKV
jgi:hypothetical protein